MINFSELLWKPGHGSSEAPKPSFRNQETVEHDDDLAKLPCDEANLTPESRISYLSDPSGVSADRFRYLRMRLRELKDLTRLKSIIVTSPLPQDGKTTVVLSLATALAEGGRRSVLVIEADLHHPTAGLRLGLSPRKGLAECLESGIDPLSMIRRIDPLSWYLMQAGTSKENCTELLQSDVLPALMRRMSNYFDWILVDTPPVVPLTDSVALSRHADATLMVVRADYTPKDAIEKALALIGPKYVLGIVFNGAELLDCKYPGYEKYYPKKK
jgi:capsular exopolysaccharide synthesis family protein